MKTAIVYFKNNHNKNLLEIVAIENSGGNLFDIYYIEGCYDMSVELVRIKNTVDYKAYDYIVCLNDINFIKDWGFLNKITDNCYYKDGYNYVFCSKLLDVLDTKAILYSQVSDKKVKLDIKEIDLRNM